ncbi:MAG: DUF4833 domain-containing protein [Bacteroidales bacterium]|nr:DUF4833 domain-containing protein [Bacteroidales bacterium]
MKYQLYIIALLLIHSLTFGQSKKYPVPPETDKLLFYIQRNHNANTIVYDANFDKTGKLNKDKPIDVYWLRYEEQGQKMELRSIEKWYAYGVDCKKTKPNTFDVKLVADKARKFTLVQTKSFKAVLITQINNKEAILNHMYIFAEETDFWPTVKYIELFGNEIQTGLRVYQKIIIDKDGI